MAAWQITLIVIGCLIFVLFFILPTIILIYAGRQTVKTMDRENQGFPNMKMDISFYSRGPVKALADEGVEYMKTLNPKDLYITSYDGLKLHAYYYKNPNEETNKYFLGMHGFKSGPIHEYAPYIKRYFDLGFNVIVPDERAHYKSEGKYLTMGIRERYDVLDWSKFIVKEFGEDIEILIQGISMGAASVCLASNLDLPKQVMGIISDCAYSSFKDQIIYTMKHNFNMPAFPIINAINMNLKHYVGVSFDDETPLQAVKNAKVPMLFIHGDQDEMVPVKFVHELYEACGSRKKLYTVANANHAESAARNMDKYFNTITEFFKISQ